MSGGDYGDMDQMLRAALAYAEMGFAVFPCISPGKAPLTEHGFKDATKDAEVIRALWLSHPGANVGIATGAISGIVVLDIDPRHAGDDTLEALEAHYGKLPETPTVLTGGGGVHSYFRHPGGIVSNSAGKVGQGIDVRGDGGYVIAPKSMHESGNRYLWEVSSRIDQMPLADAPPWLRELMVGAEVTRTSDAKRFDPPSIFQDGTRNEYLYRTARSAHAKFKLNADELLNLLHGINQSRCRPPIDEVELATIANNAATQADRSDFKPPPVVDPDVERLAKLAPLEYDKCRKEEAKRLKVRVDTLDDAVAKARKKDQQAASGIELRKIVPWSAPVEACALFDEVRNFVKRFLVLTPEQLTTIVLWILFAHAFEVAEVSPRLALLSPKKRCGKSTAERVLGLLCPSPLTASNISPAAIFRTIETIKPTLLLDEVDSFASGGKQKSERSEEIRGILNSGHTREQAFVIRNVKQGDDWVPRQFSTWAPIVYAAIGRLPDTWEDRSIKLTMKRRLKTEKVEKMTRRNLRAVQKQAAELASKLVRWAQDNLESLRIAEPKIPAGLNDRAEDNWDLLLAIADRAAGEAWGNDARAAAVSLSGDRDQDADDSFDIKLLADIREILGGTGNRTIGSTDLCTKLAAMESSPWGSMRPNDKPITPRRLAAMLKPFEVHPKKAADRNEYDLADLDNVFSRYLPISAFQTSKAPRTVGGVAQNDDLQTSSDGGLKSADAHTERTGSGRLEVHNGKIDVDAEREAEIDRLAAADAAKGEEDEEVS